MRLSGRTVEALIAAGRDPAVEGVALRDKARQQEQDGTPRKREAKQSVMSGGEEETERSNCPTQAAPARGRAERERKR